MRSIASTPPAAGAGVLKKAPAGLSPAARLAAIAAVVLIGLSFLFPLWTLHLKAPQYPESLNLHVYAYKFAGSGNPMIDDLAEINTLNHYIGMAELHEQDFRELDLMPVAIGVSGLAIAGAATFMLPALLAAGTAILALTGGLGLGSAYFKLYAYGHNLDPSAPLKIPSFTPPLLGSNRLVNFETIGMFGPGGVMLVVAGGLLLFAMWHTWRSRRSAV